MSRARKLTPEQRKEAVEIIVAAPRRGRGRLYAELAARFGVAPITIERATLGGRLPFTVALWHKWLERRTRGLDEDGIRLREGIQTMRSLLEARKR